MSPSIELNGHIDGLSNVIQGAHRSGNRALRPGLDASSLAARIQSLTQQLSKWASVSAPGSDLSDNLSYQSLVSDLAHASQSLLLAVQSPKAFFQSFQLGHYDLVAWQIAVEFDLFSALPLAATAAGGLSCAELAAASGDVVDAELVGRVLRNLSLHGVFERVGEDRWVHSKLSAFLAENKGVRAALAMQLDEFFAASSAAAESVKATADLKRQRQQQERKQATAGDAGAAQEAIPTAATENDGTAAASGHATGEKSEKQADERTTAAPSGNGWEDREDEAEVPATTTITPFQQRFGEPIYSFYDSPAQADRSARFGQAMAGAAFLDSASLADMRAAYPWEKLAAGTVVDIGGGQGQLCMALAEANHHLSFLVQDIFPPSESALASAAVATTASGPGRQPPPRISFQSHSFFEPQPPLPAGVPQRRSAFLLKHVLHNHPDDKCVAILRHIAAAAAAAAESWASGSSELPPPSPPILIAEGVVGHADNTWAQERTLSRGDLCMFTTLGARERTEREFAHLCRRADARLSVRAVWGAGVTRIVEVGFVREGEEGGDTGQGLN